MAAGGMAGDRDPAGIAVEAARVLVEPFHRRPVLAHDLGHRHGRAQVVVQDGDGDAGLGQPLGDEAEFPAAQRMPVAAVDEQVDRRIRRPGRVEIEMLGRGRAVGNIKFRLQLAPHPLAVRQEEIDSDAEILDRGFDIVLRVDLRLGAEIAVQEAVPGRPCRRRRSGNAAGNGRGRRFRRRGGLRLRPGCPGASRRIAADRQPAFGFGGDAARPAAPGHPVVERQFDHRRAAAPDRPVGMDVGAAPLRAHPAEQPFQMFHAHVAPGIFGIVRQQGAKLRGVAGDQRIEQAAVPVVVGVAGEAVLGRVDLAPVHRAGQAADTDQRDPLALLGRALHGKRRQPAGQRAVVIEIVRGQDERPVRLRVEQVSRNDGAGVDGETVVIHRLRAHADIVGLVDAGLGQFGIDIEIVGQVSESVPVFVDMDAAHPRPRLPELVEHRDPLGRVDQQHIRPRLLQGTRRVLVALEQSLPAGRVGTEQRQRRAGHEEGGDDSVAVAALAAPSEPADQVGQRRRLEQVAPGRAGVARAAQHIDRADDAARQHENHEDRGQPENQQGLVEPAGEQPVDDDEDQGADDRAGQAAHAAGDDHEDEIGRPEHREGRGRRQRNRLDEIEAGGEAGECPGQHEGEQLDLGDVDADGSRRLGVVAHGGQRQADPAVQQRPDDPGREDEQDQADIVQLLERDRGRDAHAAARTDQFPFVEDGADRRRDQPGRHCEIGAFQGEQRHCAEENEQQDHHPADIGIAEHVPPRIVVDEDFVADPKGDRDGDRPEHRRADQAGAHRDRQQEGEGGGDQAGDRHGHPDMDAAVIDQDRHGEAGDADIDLVAEGQQPAIAGQQVPGMAEHGEHEQGQQQLRDIAVRPERWRQQDQHDQSGGDQRAGAPAGEPSVEEAAQHRPAPSAAGRTGPGAGPPGRTGSGYSRRRAGPTGRNRCPPAPG